MVPRECRGKESSPAVNQQKRKVKKPDHSWNIKCVKKTLQYLRIKEKIGKDKIQNNVQNSSQEKIQRSKDQFTIDTAEQSMARIWSEISLSLCSFLNCSSTYVC